MDISPDPSNVPPFRRASTTVVGNVVLSLAALGFLFSAFFLVRSICDFRTSAEPPSVFLIHNAFAMLSKIALWTVGVFLIRRLSQVRWVGAAGLIISLIDSAYYIIAVVPPLRSAVHAAMAAGMTLGAWISAVLAVILYVVIFVYLEQSASLQEFRKGNG
jgi:hypothetical protein